MSFGKVWTYGTLRISECVNLNITSCDVEPHL